MIKMTIQDAEETAEFKVLEKPIIQKPLIAESDVVTIDNNLSTYVTGTQKRELTVGLGYLDSAGYETLRRIRDRQYAVLKYPTVTITADEPIEMGYGEDVPDYRQRLVQLKGKNLFDKSTETNYFIDSNGTLIAGSTWSLSDYIKISPNTTYIWHGEKTGALSGQVIWAGFNGSKAFISGQYAQINETTALFTTGNATEYIRVGYRNDRLRNMQLEVGPTATTYEPYYDIELCKIGEYQDKIYKGSDGWYLRKEIGVVALNGTETWEKYSDGIFYAQLLDKLVMPINAEVICYCSDYMGCISATSVTTFINAASSYKYATGLHRTAKVLRIKNVDMATAGDLTTWFINHPTKVYYAVATPTDTKITDEALIAQLEALTESAFDRWTRVQTEAQSGNLTPNITVSQGTLSGTGTDVMLDGTTEDLLDFVILGDTSQQTYSGKNLFSTSTVTTGYSVATQTISAKDDTTGSFEVQESGSYAGSGAWSAYAITSNIQLEPSTRYTLSRGFSVVSGTTYTGAGNIRAKIGNSYTDPATNTPLTFTTNSTGVVQLLFYTAYNQSAVSTINTKIKFYNVQLEKNISASSFEPYVGGVPAPNPNYPQEVQTVNGDINFDFSGPSGVKKYIMVGKMTLAEQRIIDYCGTNEQVQVSFRESKQL